MKILKNSLVVVLIIATVLSVSSCRYVIINHNNSSEDGKNIENTEEKAVLPDTYTVHKSEKSEKKAQAKAYLSALPNVNFGSDSFTVAVYDGFRAAPPYASNGYEAVLIERNRLIEEKYGVVLKELSSPLSLLLSDSYNAYLNKSDYADVLIIPAKKLGEFSEKNFLLNLKSLPGFSCNYDYFDTENMEKATAGLKYYAIMGDFTRDIGSYYCVYVNTELIKNHGLADPCEYVKNGNWTWDKMIEYINAVPERYSISCADKRVLVKTVLKSAGVDLMSGKFNEVPVISYDTETAKSAISTIRSLINYSRAYFPFEGDNSASREFAAGNVLFAVGTVAEMSEYACLGREWTVLPIPKANELQETYVSYLSDNAPIMVVSAGTLHPERTAVMIKALNAASYGFLDEGYYDYLTETAVNNSSTLDMLDYVCGVKEGKCSIEFADLYSEVYPHIIEDTVDTVLSLVDNPSLDLSREAYYASYDLNWRMVNSFPCYNN